MPFPNAPDPVLSASAVAALRAGRVIDAIKAVRQDTGLGLKEAKDVVDRYITGHPELQATLRQANQASARQALLWLVIIGAVVLAAYAMTR